MQTAARWRIAHFLYAIDFPRIAFRNQAVKKGADRAANTAKENLHDCRGTAHFHETKLDALRIRHVAVIAPDHRFELRQGELLLHAAGGLPIRTRVIRDPKRRELLLHD